MIHFVILSILDKRGGGGWGTSPSPNAVLSFLLCHHMAGRRRKNPPFLPCSGLQTNLSTYLQAILPYSQEIFFFFLLGMTEGASQCLWDKCLRVATSEGKEISLLAPRHLRRGCGALVQDIYFLNSSTESRLLGEVSITKDTQMTDDTTVLAENEE